jgi:hypothetical protein
MPHQERERGTKKKRRSKPMPHRKGGHLNNNKGLLRKIKGQHLFLVNQDKGVLRKIKGGHLCHISKGDMYEKINGY